MDHEKIPVKLIGGGRNKDYGYLGFSHWAEKDIDILSNLKNIHLYKPNQLNYKIFNNFIYNKQPSYLNLKR